MDLVSWALNLFLLGMAAFAAFDVIRRPTEAFPAVDRQTKTAWLIFMGLSVGLVLVFPPISGGFSFLGIIGVIVSMFYLVDVRPKVREITRSR